MPSTLDQTKWGQLLLDVETTIRELKLVDDERVVPLPRPMLKTIAPPCITVIPGDKRYKQTFNNLVDVGYGVQIAYIRANDGGTDAASLALELQINELLSRRFHFTRGWATGLGGALLWSEVETTEFNLEEARGLGYDVQYFTIRCWVRELLEQ